MGNSKKNRLVYVIALCILVLSLAMTIIDWAVPLNLWIHPLLNFVFFIFCGFGVFSFVLGFIKKSPWYFFLSAGLLALSVLYVLISYKMVWYVTLLIVVCVPAIIALLSLIVNGNKTEDIALNKSDDYKTYEERKAFKEAAEKEEPQEELPEIKSFK
ncbi:MAG: hypothetical protein E7369_04225 [Clostridiales bacterium]|nr:hypothetical protein [Clostridiales bacterium]